MDSLFIIRFFDQPADVNQIGEKLYGYTFERGIDLAYLGKDQSDQGVMGIVRSTTGLERDTFFEFIRKEIVADLNGFTGQPLGDALTAPITPSQLTPFSGEGEAGKWARVSVDDIITGFDLKATAELNSDSNPYAINTELKGGIGGMDKPK